MEEPLLEHQRAGAARAAGEHRTWLIAQSDVVLVEKFLPFLRLGNEPKEKTPLFRERWQVTAITLVARYIGRHEPDEVTIPCRSLSRFDPEVKTEYVGGIPSYSWVVTNAYILASGIDLTVIRKLTWRPTQIVFNDSETGEQKEFFVIGMDIISQPDTAKYFINGTV
jgi:hypothetical protein